jgi:hypothetical protein
MYKNSKIGIDKTLDKPLDKTPLALFFDAPQFIWSYFTLLYNNKNPS